MLIAFVPVLHRGYIDFFRKYPGSTLGILGTDVVDQFTSLSRDQRTLSPEIAQSLVEQLGIFANVQILRQADLERLSVEGVSVIMPKDDVSHALAERYFPQRTTFASVFLRWTKTITLQENIVPPNRTISHDAFLQEVMNKALTEAQKSADWWRQVGAVFLKDGDIIAEGHNRHLPSDFHLAFNGDPRTNFNAGERIDLSTAIHAEAGIIATCAKKGLSVEGSSAFVTTFPCPNCARLLAESGVKKVYYQQGYSLLDAEAILQAYNVEIVLVPPSLPNTRE